MIKSNYGQQQCISCKELFSIFDDLYIFCICIDDAILSLSFSAKNKYSHEQNNTSYLLHIHISTLKTK